MKKFFAIIICSFYLLSTQICFAANNLYFVKNTQKSVVSDIVSQVLTKEKNYNITKQNPYLAISTKNGSDYILIILQTSSENLFYYFQSSKDEKVDKEIKKLLKKQNIIFEQSYNTMYISTFENQAQKILTNTTSKYTFDEPAQQATISTTNRKKDNNVLKGYVGQVAKGSVFNAYLQTPINTANANIGDNVTAVLTEDWVYNGYTIAPQGSLVTGELTKARHATYGSRNGRVVINFTQVTTPESKVYEVSTEKIDFTITNDGKFQSTVSSALKGALIGAVGGLIVGLLSKDANVGVSTAIGAGVGAGTGLAGSAVEKGVDAEIPVYTELELTLTKPLNVVIGL
ncbi:hypothetical protein IKE67_09925 [bacterium]|nr:hypothetical protein [bacterium]